MNNIGHIRMAVFDDAPDILAIYQECDYFVNKVNRQDNIGLIDVIHWIEDATGKHPVLVIEHQKELLAWCSLEPFYGLPAFDSASEISFYITLSWQRKGLGSQLFQYIEAKRNSFEFTHLIAYIYNSNLSSLEFFKQQNFKTWGILPNIARNGDLKENVVLLGREF